MSIPRKKRDWQTTLKACPQRLAPGDQYFVGQIVVLLGSAVIPPLAISSKMQVPLVHVSTMRCPTLIPDPFTPLGLPHFSTAKHPDHDLFFFTSPLLTVASWTNSRCCTYTANRSCYQTFTLYQILPRIIIPSPSRYHNLIWPSGPRNPIHLCESL